MTNNTKAICRKTIPHFNCPFFFNTCIERKPHFQLFFSCINFPIFPSPYSLLYLFFLKSKVGLYEYTPRNVLAAIQNNILSIPLSVCLYPICFCIYMLSPPMLLSKGACKLPRRTPTANPLPLAPPPSDLCTEKKKITTFHPTIPHY